MHILGPVEEGRFKNFAAGAARLLILCLLPCCSADSGGPGAPETGAAPGRPPNFVIVLTDDQGYGDLGAYGAADIRTPHLDRMAGEGLRFTNFYMAGPVCTPSRAGLLTGCYPKRVCLHQGVLWPNQAIGLNPREVTIAEILKGRGYATACVGKWHLGRPAELLPTRQGFDTYFGVPYSNDMTPESLMSLLGGNFPPLPLMRDEQVVEAGVDNDTLTERYTAEALRFIRQNRERPFFLYLAHNMPHYPCGASEPFRDTQVTPAHRGIYASAVEEVDWGMGQILAALRELGLDRNTLVVFTSDNGPWKTARTLYHEPTGSARPLRGWKSQTWEGGMRVPAIVWWPGRLPAGVECDRLATALDLLPTLAARAGAELPEGPEHRIDGLDISVLLENPGAASPHQYFYYYDSDTGLLEAVRDAEGWKLHVRKDLDRVRKLYYLPGDEGESVNVYSEHRDVVARLERASEDFDREIAENQRPVGESNP